MGRKREYEAPDMGAMMGRLLRAMARRAADGDLEALSVLQKIQSDLDAARVAAAQGAHAFGYSWTQIGNELGTSRQNARQTYGARQDGVA